ncbi:MAG TPA: ArgP/LysG family DNA-binding transcriptional regulator [Chlamydiales bacterium]|nr:ArgP/LysG family DNA-binding transcriptional regulator [Chlamydiales bacterium]
MTLDYKGLEALYTIQEVQSFEGAAKKLHITQSAISQRIKSLETFYGEPVLIRTFPYQPTELGKRLIGHFKRISLLEDELNKEIGKSESLQRIAIAINRDSLETWFIEWIRKTDLLGSILLEVIADDQERTIDYLKNGLVTAALSTAEKEILGGKAQFVGNMEYVLTATPEFVKTHLSKEKNLLTAPALKFDLNDQLHEKYLEKFFGLNGKEINYHVVPSVQAFKQMALSGFAYGLIPRIDIEKELKVKKLIEIYENKVWKVPLYWHYWAIESKTYQKFNQEIIRFISQKLGPAAS